VGLTRGGCLRPVTTYSEEFSLAEFQAMRGLGKLERVNPKLYLDYDDPKKVRAASGRLRA